MNEENNNTDPFLEGRNLARASENFQEEAGTGGNGGPNADAEPRDSQSQDLYREGTASYSGSYQGNPGGYQENPGSYSYQGGYQYQNYDEPPRESMGFGIASMVLGIIALVLFCSCINIVLAIVSVIFGILHLVNCKGGKGFAIAGITMSALSVVACIVVWVCFFNSPAFQDEIQRQMKNQEEIYNDFYYPYGDDDEYERDYRDDDDRDDSLEFRYDDDDDFDNKTF